jgi:HD-GYP domain-containing protein (c-di-GMP phosphodiesterase class II)
MRLMVPRLDRVAAVVVSVTATSLVVLALLALRGDDPHHYALQLAFLLGPIAVIGRLFPIQIAFRRRMVTDTAALFAAAILLGPFAAGIVAAVSIALAEAIVGRKHFDWRQVAFNASQASLGVCAAAYAFNTWSPGAFSAGSSEAAMAAGLAAIIMLVVNDMLVFSIVWAQTAVRLHHMVGDFVRGRVDLPQDIALYIGGFLAAVGASVYPWTLVVVAAPLPLLYRTMKDHMALKLQTREAVIAMADIVDTRDSYTFGHCRRVGEFTEQLCQQMGLPKDMTDEIVLAARIHDLGKIGIRDSVLLKPARLDHDEFCHMMEHPEIGARLTRFLPEFQNGTRYIRHHHEKFDGTGYPDKLAGEAIPLGARIIAVTDTFDAITSTRVYRPGQDENFARKEMARVCGSQFDPVVVRAWFRLTGWQWPEEIAGPEDGAIVNEVVTKAA